MKKAFVILPLLVLLAGCRDDGGGAKQVETPVATPVPVEPKAEVVVAPSPVPTPEVPKVVYRKGFEEICKQNMITLRELDIQDHKLTIYPEDIFQFSYVVEKCTMTDGWCGSLPFERKSKWGTQKYLGKKDGKSQYALEGIGATYTTEEWVKNFWKFEFFKDNFQDSGRISESTRPLTDEEQFRFCTPVVEVVEKVPTCEALMKPLAMFTSENPKFEIKVFGRSDELYNKKYILRVENFDCLTGISGCSKIHNGSYVEVDDWLDMGRDDRPQDIHYGFSGQYGFTSVNREKGAWHYTRNLMEFPVVMTGAVQITDEDAKLLCKGERY